MRALLPCSASATVPRAPLLQALPALTPVSASLAATSRLGPRPRTRTRPRSIYTGPQWLQRRGLSLTAPRRSAPSDDDLDDPRLEHLGRQIFDDYAQVKEHYATPRNPLVLAHGLLGFSILRAHDLLPPIHYWHGITSAFRSISPELPVLTPSVPPSGTIAERAEALAASVAEAFPGQSVNVVAHSMGGLDARCMISSTESPAASALLASRGVRVASLVTIATPHRGSAFADFMMDEAGLEGWYPVIGKVGLGTGAFRQLTRPYMEERFNPTTPDAPATRYFSFGACTDRPGLLSPFRASWQVVDAAEGPNDGLVAVNSASWGEYRGTLRHVSHLDLINWTNWMRWEARKLWNGRPRSFNAVALYLGIADMLAKEGL